MTDKEIIKSFEYHYVSQERDKCNDCPFGRDRVVCFEVDLCEIVLDLIKRQQEAITEYQEEMYKNIKEIKDLQYELDYYKNTPKIDVRKEIIKELIDCLDDHIALYRENGKSLDVYRWLQNYIKDVLGEEIEK